MDLPYLVFCDKKGKIYRHPSLKMAVSAAGLVSVPRDKELIRIPKGSTLFFLPKRHPIGFDERKKEFIVLDKFEGREVFVLTAFPIPAYLRLYSPANLAKDKEVLPLWPYTACGFFRGNFYITAKRVDNRIRQSPGFYNDKLVQKSVKEFFKLYPDNRLYAHLANCALNYNCLAAKNLFLQRWEAPLPTSRFCNARCIGCLNSQTKISASHERIDFKPELTDLLEVMVNHLKVAREAIVSFGQGCEGEPLLEADLIADSVSEARKIIKRGTINVNTNASIPKKIEQLCRAGVDSFRVSLNSTDEKSYNLYFKPINYAFSDVLKSIDIAKKHNKFVAINLFVFPGFTDSEEQIKSLIRFIKVTKIDMIQWRNLSIDPDYYISKVIGSKVKPKGINYLLDVINRKFPALKTGYFNLPLAKRHK